MLYNYVSSRIPSQANPDADPHVAASSVGGKKRTLQQKWTQSEDALLRNVVSKLGPYKWPHIAEHINGRSAKQCRQRWHNQLCPSINSCTFTPDENLLLLEMHALFGNNWSTIRLRFKGRTDNALKRQLARLSGARKGKATTAVAGTALEQDQFDKNGFISIFSKFMENHTCEPIDGKLDVISKQCEVDRQLKRSRAVTPVQFSLESNSAQLNSLYCDESLSTIEDTWLAHKTTFQDGWRSTRVRWAFNSACHRATGSSYR